MYAGEMWLNHGKLYTKQNFDKKKVNTEQKIKVKKERAKQLVWTTE